MTLHTLHLVVLAIWLGVVAVEAVIEWLPRRHPELAPAATALHFWIDLLIELPLLVAVVTTGGLLLRGRLIDPMLAIKLAAGGTAIGMNLLCVALVVARYRGDSAGSAARTRMIYATAVVGMPLGLLALALGLGRMAW